MRARPALAAALALAASPAAAFDKFEIQVYEPELNAPGEVGVELHTNFVASGSRDPTYPGEIPAWHVAHFTLEPAYGLASWIELGAYLQGFTAPGNGVEFGGVKVRAKMVAWEPPPRGFFLGLNVELGRVPTTVEQAGWANEFRPFLGWRDAWWLLDLNPIFGTTLSGADKFRFDLSPAAKVALDTHLGFAVGVEWYAELGFVDAILPFDRQAHYLFGVVDLAPTGHERPTSPWELNLAVGGGLQNTPEGLIVKTIVGRSF